MRGSKPGYRWVTTFAEYDLNGVLLREEGYWYKGPWDLLHATANLDQDSYAFYSDGTESGAVIVGSANAQQTLEVDTTYHCRLLIQEDGGGSLNNQIFTWQYRKNTGTWTNITTTSSDVIAVNSTSLTDNGDTTQRIGAGTFISPNAMVCEDGVTDGTVDFAGNDEVEALLAFQIVGADVNDNDQIEFQVLASGDTLTYTRLADSLANKAVVYDIAGEVATIALTGQDATIASADNVSAEVATLALTGHTATVDYGASVETEVATLALTGQGAAIASADNVDTNTANMTFTAHQADVVLAESSNIGVIYRTVLTQTGTGVYRRRQYRTVRRLELLQEAAASPDVNISANTADLTFTGLTATLTYGSNVDTNTADLSLTGLTASLTYDSNVTTNTADMAFEGLAAGVSYDSNVTTSTADLVLTGLTASLVYDSNVETNAADLSFTGLTATLIYDSNIEASTTSLALTGEVATLTYNSNIEANTSSISLTGLAATVTAVGGTTTIAVGAGTVTVFGYNIEVVSPTDKPQTYTGSGGFDERLKDEDEALLVMIEEFMKKVA